MAWFSRKKKLHIKGTPRQPVETAHVVPIEDDREFLIRDRWTLKEWKQIEAQAEQAAMVDGKHYTEHIPTIDKMRKNKDDEASEALLLKICDATIAETYIRKEAPAPGYFERLAIIYRRRKDYDSEIAILQRYLDAAERAENPCQPDHPFHERISKAQALKAKGS